VLQAISASILQGSAVGLASYVVNASDLKAVTVMTHMLSSRQTMCTRGQLKRGQRESMGQCEQSQTQSSQLCRDHLLRNQAKTTTSTTTTSA